MTGASHLIYTCGNMNIHLSHYAGMLVFVLNACQFFDKLSTIVKNYKQQARLRKITIVFLTAVQSVLWRKMCISQHTVGLSPMVYAVE